MNYYEHHIGDYAEATSHLTFVEDAAYSRLIRKYYATEKPLPADIKSVQRLVGARTKEERDAVAVVLEEFFTLHEDGWHNSRCDEEISRFAERQPRAEEKRESAAERQRRARERRKTLFETLSQHGVHMPWNATTEALQAALNSVTSHTCHAPVTPPVTRDNTCTQTPDTRHQSPIPSSHTLDDRTPLCVPVGDGPIDGDMRPTPAGVVCRMMRAEGIADGNPGHPTLRMLIDAGASDEEFVGAARTARERGKGFAYALAMLKRQREEATLAAQTQPRGPVRVAAVAGPTLSDQRAAAASTMLSDYIDDDGRIKPQPNRRTSDDERTIDAGNAPRLVG